MNSIFRSCLILSLSLAAIGCSKSNSADPKRLQSAPPTPIVSGFFRIRDAIPPPVYGLRMKPVMRKPITVRSIP